MITEENKELSKWLKAGDRFRIYAKFGVSDATYHNALSRENPEDMTAKEREIYAFFLKVVEMRKRENEELLAERRRVTHTDEED